MRALAALVALVLAVSGICVLASSGGQRGTHSREAVPLAPGPGARLRTATAATTVGAVVVLSEASAATTGALDLHRPGIDEEAGNHLLAALVSNHAPGLAGELLTIAQDARHTPRWRNYAVQHLTDLQTRDGDETSRAALRWAAGSDEPLVREAGVFGLARVAADRGEGIGDAQTVIDQALTSHGSDLVTEAAIRGLVLLGWRERNQQLIAFVARADAALALRVAAADALGVLGGSGERQELERVRAQLQPRRDGEVLATALDRACARLMGGAAERAF